MKKLVFLFFVASAPFVSFAQKTFFDKAGKITSEEQAYYYRQKAEGADVYKCYYVNGGALYFEGKIIKTSDSSESKNVYAETCIWYFKSGKKKSVRTFTASGIENGTSNYYFESGKLWKEIEFVNGEMAGNRYKEYDEDGQSSRIFEEDFLNNHNDWDLYTSDKSYSRLSSGALEIGSFSAEGTTRYINLSSQTQDYAVEEIINIEKLKEGEKAGMIFGFKDWQNYNYFLITQSSFYVGFVYEGVSSTRVEGMFSSAINKKAANNLKVIGVGDKNFFSINGEVQYSSDKMRNFGSNVGVAVGGKNSVSIDKLIYKEIDFKNSGASASAGDFNVKASGSGLVFTQSGYIVTNHHVIDNANKILVEISVGGIPKTYSAAVVQKDIDNDLAIVKINDDAFKPLEPLPYSFKEGGGVDVGASVFTIGFPMALGGMGKEAKFTDGKISSKTGYNNAINTYQTSIPVQPGNSGSPLFNDKGQLVGVINAKITGADNVSYAIKLNYLRNLIDLLPETVELPSSQSLANATIEEKVKALSGCVVLIKVK